MFYPFSSNRAEMMGAPGCGKSWLQAALSERLAGRVATPATIGEVPPTDRLDALREDPRIVAFLEEGQRLLAQGDAAIALRQSRKLWLSRELATVLRAEAAEQPVLCDEGLIQRGISVANSYGDGGLVAKRYFRTVPPPRAVIVVGTPRGLIAARIGARGPSQSYHLLELDRTLAHVATGLRILAERGTAIIAADGARLAIGDETELARIAQTLQSILAGRS